MTAAPPPVLPDRHVSPWLDPERDASVAVPRGRTRPGETADDGVAARG